MIECALPESSAMEDTILGSYTSHKVIPEIPMIDGAADGGDEIPTTEKIMRMFPAMEKNHVTVTSPTRDDVR